MILFASDLHLSPATPGIARTFSSFLRGPARDAEALYLLGDIFDSWAGDEDLDTPFNARVAADLRACTAGGVFIGWLAGNRDFLIGDAFAAATGVNLLPDPFALSVPSWQFVLTHGDCLCTDDVDYQKFRAEVRGSDWIARFLAKPYRERTRIVSELRARSESAKHAKSAEDRYQMDVNRRTTDDFLHAHGYATLIHGHTHRPATHDHLVDGIQCQRWVLSDWHEDENTGRGEYIAWDGAELTRHTVA